VDKFVEFFGTGVSRMSLADRATISNMAPEYGATMGFFPVDNETLNYLRATGRTKDEIDLVERYCKEQGLFRTDSTPAPTFTKPCRSICRRSILRWPAQSGRKTAWPWRP